MNSCNGFFERLSRLLDPVGFVFFCVIATFCISLLKGLSLHEIADAWSSGFWSLAGFTLHILMTFILGYAVAQSPFIKTALHKMIAALPSQWLAPALFVIVGILSLISWGVGLVASALLCLEVLRTKKSCNARLLIVASYSGFIMWHGGLTGSIPLSVVNNDPVLTTLKALPLPFSSTIFSSWHLALVCIMLLGLVCFWFFFSRCDRDSSSVESGPSAPEQPLDPVSCSEAILHKAFVLGAGAVVGYQVVFAPFQGMQTVNSILFVLALACYRGWTPFCSTMTGGLKSAMPILIQFPLYAGLASVLRASGVIESLTSLFLNVATAKTLPLFTFLVAGLVNIVIPSGGGQWIIQGPIVMKMAQALNVDYAKVVMALAWGDSWTNLIQPFWMLPVLYTCNISLKFIMGYCLYALIFTGVVLSFFFYIIA